MGYIHFCQFSLTLEVHSQKPYEQRNVLRLDQAVILLMSLLPCTNLMRLPSDEGEGSERDEAYGPLRHQNIHTFASSNGVNCAQGNTQLAFACFGPKSENNLHVHFTQASPHEFNSISYGKKARTSL